MSDKVFAQGLYVKPPKDNAPEFVKFSLSMKREELIQWLTGQTDEWINTDVKVAKSGKWYAEVWKPKGQTRAPKEESWEDDIPFS